MSICRQEVLPDPRLGGSVIWFLAVLAAGRVPQRVLRLAGAAAAPGFRKDVTPLNRTPGGLMEHCNASLQRGRQG